MIHFSNNPQFKFDLKFSSTTTPAGAFGYLLADPISGFGEHRKYIFIYRPKSLDKFIVVPGKTFLDNRIPELKQMLIQKMNLSPERQEKIYSKTYSRFPFSEFYELTKIASKDEEGTPNPIQWTNILKSFGIDGIIDRGTGMLYSGERYQTVTFSPDQIELLYSGENPKHDMSLSRHTL